MLPTPVVCWPNERTSCVCCMRCLVYAYTCMIQFDLVFHDACNVTERQSRTPENRKKKRTLCVYYQSVSRSVSDAAIQFTVSFGSASCFLHPHRDAVCAVGVVHVCASVSMCVTVWRFDLNFEKYNQRCCRSEKRNKRKRETWSACNRNRIRNKQMKSAFVDKWTEIKTRQNRSTNLLAFV